MILRIIQARRKIMKTKIISLLMATLLTAAVIGGCGNAKAEDSGKEVSGTGSTAAESTDSDDNLYMQVKSFNETSFTGDLCREERIRQEYVEGAEIGKSISSINGTQFTAVSFEDVNKELEYDTDEVFKKDASAAARFDGFLVKCSDDDFYYALEKEGFDNEYLVVTIFTDEALRKTIEENVTYNISEDCQIYLQKVVDKDGASDIESEYIIGRDFKGDNYPGWSEGATEYYLTDNMLMDISVKDGELTKAVQVFVP